MTQDGDATSRKGTEKRTAEITSLAKAAISVLARQSAPTPEGLARRLETLSEAFISPEEAHRHDALTKLAQEGVSIEDTIDYVIPATARLMGFRWANDSLSFAEVSIGSARLQETVRGLTTQQRREIVKNRGTILLVVPYPEHHTLGVFVVADQLRRRGYDVHISVSQHARQVAERVKRFKYDMIGVTAAGRRTLASVKTATNNEWGIRAGTSSGLASSGYDTIGGYWGGSNGGTQINDRWACYGSASTGFDWNGQIIIYKMSGNLWQGFAWYHYNSGGTSRFAHGEVSLGGTLDRIGFTGLGANFNSGTIYPSYMEP